MQTNNKIANKRAVAKPRKKNIAKLKVRKSKRVAKKPVIMTNAKVKKIKKVKQIKKASKVKKAQVIKSDKTVLNPKSKQIKKAIRAKAKCSSSTNKSAYKKENNSFWATLKSYWDKFLCYFSGDSDIRKQKPTRGKNPKTILKSSKSPIIKKVAHHG